MGKTLLIHVLFFVIIIAAQGTEVKRENTSKLLSNLFDMFSGLATVSIMFIFINFIIVCTKKVSIILVYKLQDFCIFSVLVTVLKALGTLLTCICTNFSGISNEQSVFINVF